MAESPWTYDMLPDTPETPLAIYTGDIDLQNLLAEAHCWIVRRVVLAVVAT
jgi:hypothetical protein